MGAKDYDCAAKGRSSTAPLRQKQSMLGWRTFFGR
jgi:hypothetical protein